MKNNIYTTVRVILAAALITSSLTFTTSRTNAADGDLDLTFGTGGIVTTDLNLDDEGHAVAIQTDGKIVVAGSQTLIAAPQFGLARYNTNGSLDTTFDGDGKVTTSIGFSSRAHAVAIQPDGKIVAVGTTDLGLNDSDFAVVRYNTNGTIDTTFGSTGIILTRFLTGIDNFAHAVAIQGDGKIVVAGESSDILFFRNFALARYNTNGSLDTTFDGDGKLTTTFAVTAGAKSVFIQSDGKITAAGTGNLARYSSTGALDPSFGTGGRVFINNLSINAAKIQSDGNIVVAGSTIVSGDAHFGLARITPTGFFDTTFNTGGRVSTNFGTLNIATSLVIQTDGKIIAAGFSRIGASNVDFALARYNTNGSLDTSFSDDGKVTTDILPNDNAAGATLQPDGKIVVVGRAVADLNTGNFALARYQSGGTAVVPRPNQFDFDADGRTDVAVWRPSDGNWHILRSLDGGYHNAVWGASGDRIATGDYDNDNKSDIAVFRPADGTWYILNSGNGTVSQITWGTSTDIVVPGDYDDDGKTDVAVYRPSDGNWHILRSSDGGYTNVAWGINGDSPLIGDFDGDGQTDIAVRRPSSGEWFINRSTAGYISVVWGVGTDRAVPADYDGDQKYDVAVWRPSTGEWFILNSNGNTYTTYTWGAAGDVPVPGNYDGDAKDDVAVYRSGTWHLLRSTEGYQTFSWGSAADQPIPAAFVP